jgi:lysozyme family protein
MNMEAYIPRLITANQARWDVCHITPSRETEVMKVAKRLVAPAAKEQYLAIERATGVKWFNVAVIHEREASQDFNAQLGQGDPLHSVSRHVPKGRGPFKTFFDGAVDALVKCPPYASRWKNWTAGGVLTLDVEYNGIGYEVYHKEASPYIWGATDQEQWGKYVTDGVWSAHVWDTQLGCAAMLKGMIVLDPSIQFDK